MTRDRDNGNGDECCDSIDTPICVLLLIGKAKGRKETDGLPGEKAKIKKPSGSGMAHNLVASARVAL